MERRISVFISNNTCGEVDVEAEGDHRSVAVPPRATHVGRPVVDVHSNLHVGRRTLVNFQPKIEKLVHLSFRGQGQQQGQCDKYVSLFACGATRICMNEHECCAQLLGGIGKSGRPDERMDFCSFRSIDWQIGKSKLADERNKSIGFVWQFH